MAAANPPYIMLVFSTQIHNRGVAQPGSAPPWGGGGRRFKSSRPDQLASLRFQLHSQGQGRPSLVCPFGGTNVRRTFVTSPPHSCRGTRIPSPPSSLTTGVRCLRVLPSRPDQSCVPSVTSPLSVAASVGGAVFSTRMARSSIASLCPPARRGAGRMPARRARGKDATLHDLHGKGAKRRSSAPSGVCFLLVSFLCTSKEKKPAVGQPPTSRRRRRQHNENWCWDGAIHNWLLRSRAKRTIPFQSWIPASAGMTRHNRYPF